MDLKYVKLSSRHLHQFLKTLLGNAIIAWLFKSLNKYDWLENNVFGEEIFCRKRAWLHKDISFTSLNCAEIQLLMRWNCVTYIHQNWIGHSENTGVYRFTFRRNKNGHACALTVWLTLDLFFPKVVNKCLILWRRYISSKFCP
jgi:hypothetical protein